MTQTAALEEPKIRKVTYRASPTGARFHACDDFVRGVMGPVGSGKSVMGVMEMLSRAARMPRQSDGIRRARFGAIRNTYPELKSTTIKTFQDWFPPQVCTIKWDVPITAHVRINDIEFEVIFLALDRPDDVKKLKSFEFTGLWLNEASELPKAVLDMATGRVGRYPSPKDVDYQPYWSGVWMDTNPPDTDHWYYKLAEEDRPQGWSFFRQPSALIKRGAGIYIPNPAAENVEHHTEGFNYWLRMIGGKTAEWVQVFVMGHYGTVMDGKPVWPEYRDDRHCPEQEMVVQRGLPLFIGFDWGRTPACIIGQFTPRGQLRILEEIVIDARTEDCGLRRFFREKVKPHLALNYAGMSIVSTGDPAGVSKDANDQDSFVIAGEEGIPTEPAVTNDLTPRIDAVAKFMLADIDGQPGFLINRKCTILRKGLLGGYRYKRVQVTGESRYIDTPDKNAFSHPADALQYLALGVRSANHFVAPAVKRVVHTVSAQGWT